MRALTIDELEWVNGGTWSNYDNLTDDNNFDDYSNFFGGVSEFDNYGNDPNSETVVITGVRKGGINFHYTLSKLSKRMQDEQFKSCVRKNFITDQGHLNLGVVEAALGGAGAAVMLLARGGGVATGPVGAAMIIAGGAAVGELAYLGNSIVGCFNEVFSDGIAV